MWNGGAGRESDDSGAAVLPVVCAVVSAMTSEVLEWLVLHRVQEGGAMKLNGEYLDFGRPVANFLASTFDDLISRGLLALVCRNDANFTWYCSQTFAGPPIR